MGLFRYGPCNDGCCSCVRFQDKFSRDDADTIHPDKDASAGWNLGDSWDVLDGDWSIQTDPENYLNQILQGSGQILHTTPCDHSYNISALIKMVADSTYEIWFGCDDTGQGWHVEFSFDHVKLFDADGKQVGDTMNYEHTYGMQPVSVCVWHEYSKSTDENGDTKTTEDPTIVVSLPYATDTDYAIPNRFLIDSFPGNRVGLGGDGELSFDDFVVTTTETKKCPACPKRCLYCWDDDEPVCMTLTIEGDDPTPPGLDCNCITGDWHLTGGPGCHWDADIPQYAYCVPSDQIQHDPQGYGGWNIDTSAVATIANEPDTDDDGTSTDHYYLYVSMGGWIYTTWQSGWTGLGYPPAIDSVHRGLMKWRADLGIDKPKCKEIDLSSDDFEWQGDDTWATEKSISLKAADKDEECSNPPICPGCRMCGKAADEISVSISGWLCQDSQWVNGNFTLRRTGPCAWQYVGANGTLVAQVDIGMIRVVWTNVATGSTGSWAAFQYWTAYSDPGAPSGSYGPTIDCSGGSYAAGLVVYSGSFSYPPQCATDSMAWARDDNGNLYPTGCAAQVNFGG